MEEIDNLTQDDVLDLILDFPLTPRHRNVIITVNHHEPDGNVVLAENLFSDTQYVLSVGSHVQDLKPGQKVLLDVEKMVTYEPHPENAYEKIASLKLKIVDACNKKFAIVSDSVIDCLDSRE